MPPDEPTRKESYLLIAVINNESLLDDIITGWLDMGITGATVMDSTDLIQLVSDHIPIFAGFRSFTSGGMTHNKTLFLAVHGRELLVQAVAYLKTLCDETRKPHQGVYFVAPLIEFDRLGIDVDPYQRQRHVEKKLGRPIKGKESTGAE